MTWTILVFDSDSGALAFAGASAAPGVGRIVPHIAPEVGIVATQAAANPHFGADGLRLLQQGRSPQSVVSALISQDAEREARQVHVMDRSGRCAAFTGNACEGWAGDISDRNISLAGNTLAGPAVLAETLRAYREAESRGEPLPDRLLQALSAGEKAGGDSRGKQSAAVIVSRPGAPLLQLSADHHLNPISELHRLDSQRKAKQMQSFLLQNDPRMTPEQKRQAIADHFYNQMMAQPAQNVGQGLGQMIAGMGRGLADYRKEGEAFPQAPGGATPSFATTLGNFFTGRNNGGLF